MILILIVGLLLLAGAVALLLQGWRFTQARTAQALAQIDAYGFSGKTQVEGESATADVGALQQIADQIGALAPGVLAGGVKFVMILLGTAFFAILGWILPMVVLNRRARQRTDAIDYELPELIDLLVVTLEAGVSFLASLQMAAERLAGPLGVELRLTLQEQRMGLTTNEARKGMLGRADTPGMRTFVRSVLQGETLGTSTGQIMRNLAIEMRKRRRSAAEERAQKAPIKILFPLVFLIFPAMFIVLLGPALYSIGKIFGAT